MTSRFSCSFSRSSFFFFWSCFAFTSRFSFLCRSLFFRRSLFSWGFFCWGLFCWCCFFYWRILHWGFFSWGFTINLRYLFHWCLCFGLFYFWGNISIYINFFCRHFNSLKGINLENKVLLIFNERRSICPVK